MDYDTLTPGDMIEVVYRDHTRNPKVIVGRFMERTNVVLFIDMRPRWGTVRMLVKDVVKVRKSQRTEPKMPVTYKPAGTANKKKGRK